MKLPLLALLPLLLLPAPACATAAPAEYRRLIQDFLDAEPPYCLGETQWPVVSRSGEAPWLAGRLHALVDAGLARRSQNGRQAVYQLSKTGEQWYGGNGDLCYGRMEIGRINHIEAINDGMVAVSYYYRLKGLAPWAYHPTLRFAFSEMDQMVGGMDKTRYQVIINTALGGAPKLQNYPSPVEMDY
ncbi:carbapenem biosynthesis protein CpmH [Sodalis sp. RH21]|uniref:carbapenem biosynthesis protein CpmH n=1 Tax=unclassified Sodalis (in: enterobacteria) TaxID=2636512 RepID=UPI0039B55974